MTIKALTCFKAYDIRGQLDIELNEEVAYRIGRAYAEFIDPKTVVLGGDIRSSSNSLKAALSDGIRDYGAHVIDIGMVGTEIVYFATSFLNASGGIQVTASHNPINFNGMKMVREDSRPISCETGLLEIKALAEANNFPKVPSKRRGSLKKMALLDDYLACIMTFIDHEQLKLMKPMKLVVNAGNGSAGPVVDLFENFFERNKYKVKLTKMNNNPDGTFPNGIPNPMLKQNRESTIQKVLEQEADMGIAWDGDFDRCFLVDEKGRFIEGYYIVGLLAEAFLQKYPGSKIVHDPRLIWNTLDIVKKYKGECIQSKSGHTFIKEKMRKENAIYGGEMSAHHYFRDFFYCDSGMIPWLLVMELINKSGLPLSKLVDNMIEQYPSPGEINFSVKDPKDVMRKVRDHFEPFAKNLNEEDGLSLEFETWRFNVRMSNTEPLVRLNLETKLDEALMQRRLKELSQLLD